ncbi:MAG: TolC family protein [Gemmataceae bacterium]|nr:TolC family protein [Gemmataceae bacterium]
MRPRTRVSLCVLAVTAAGVLALTLVPTGPSPAAHKPPENDAVKALLTERLAALAEIHEQVLQAFKGRQVHFSEVVAAQSALLRGKLDLCETNAERVKVHEELVKAAEEMSEVVQRMVEAKVATGIDALEARVQLLDARIGLERAKAAK